MKPLRPLSLLILAAALATGCTAPTVVPADLLDVHTQGYTQVDLRGLSTQLSTYPLQAVSAAEAASLAFMREEEKLARDVYRALYYAWERKVFDNISRSEQTHTDAILMLLERYGLPDPAADREPGVFAHPELQALYEELTAQGGESPEAALMVGAAIEEIDLLDIQAALHDAVDNEDIALVYGNLMRGSRNHLRAFVANLASLGLTYEPRYLNPADYAAIIAQPVETGGQ